MKPLVMITGASSGIGNAMARVFSAAGWRTIGAGLADMGAVDYLDHYFKVDLARPEDIRSMFKQTRQQWGHLDALINNAAQQLVKSLVETETSEWDAVMAVNVRAAFLCTKYAYDLMRECGGSIINVSSVHAVATSENLAAYVTTKGALVALTRAAALELAPARIRVNALLPGAVDTQMLRAGLSRDHVHGENLERRLTQLGSRHALKRVGQPEEIAEAALFLADKTKSAFITGQTLIVDGGATARLSTE